MVQQHFTCVNLVLKMVQQNSTYVNLALKMFHLFSFYILFFDVTVDSITYYDLISVISIGLVQDQD